MRVSLARIVLALLGGVLVMPPPPAVAMTRPEELCRFEVLSTTLTADCIEQVLPSIATQWRQ